MRGGTKTRDSREGGKHESKRGGVGGFKQHDFMNVILLKFYYDNITRANLYLMNMLL